MRFEFRRLCRNSAFVVPAVLALAVGIALNCAILSTALFHAFLVAMPCGSGQSSTELPRAGSHSNSSVPDYPDWLRQVSVFVALAAWNFQDFNVAGGDQPERGQGLNVTPGLFAVRDAVEEHTSERFR